MQANTGPALFVVAQDLKLDREVDLANADASRHDKYHRGEIENARHACAHEAIGGVLGSAWRRRDDADVDPPGMHDLGEVLDVTNPHSTDHTADLGGLDVDDTGHRETPFAEAVNSHAWVAAFCVLSIRLVTVTVICERPLAASAFVLGCNCKTPVGSGGATA